MIYTQEQILPLTIVTLREAQRINQGLVFEELNFFPSECDVAMHLYTGKSNIKIANALCVQDKTVRFHCTRIYRKTGVTTRFEFMAKIRDLMDEKLAQRIEFSRPFLT